MLGVSKVKHEVVHILCKNTLNKWWNWCTTSGLSTCKPHVLSTVPCCIPFSEQYFSFCSLLTPAEVWYFCRLLDSLGTVMISFLSSSTIILSQWHFKCDVSNCIWQGRQKKALVQKQLTLSTKSLMKTVIRFGSIYYNHHFYFCFVIFYFGS